MWMGEMYLILDLDLIRSGYDRQVRLNRVVCMQLGSRSCWWEWSGMLTVFVRQSMSRCRSGKEDPLLGPISYLRFVLLMLTPGLSAAACRQIEVMASRTP